MFINRTVELDALERWWSSVDARMAMVWVRRRVGKTALTRRFAEGRRAVFHTGAGRGQGIEVSLLARQVSGIGVDGIRDLVARGYTDWDDALDLQTFLDRSQGQTRLRILLCGSAVRYMDSLQQQQQRQPLYGRADTRVPCCTRSPPAPLVTTRSGTRSGRTRPASSIAWSASGSSSESSRSPRRVTNLPEDVIAMTTEDIFS